MIPNNQQEWVDSVALSSAESRVIELGAVSSGVTVLDASQFNKLTWSIKTELAATFSVEGSHAFAFTTFDTLYSVGVIAATLCTPYNLGAPQNALGYVVVGHPFIRLRLLDTATANHTFTRLYAKAWE